MYFGMKFIFEDNVIHFILVTASIFLEQEILKWQVIIQLKDSSLF